jgi:anti-sigma B factor antagonist
MHASLQAAPNCIYPFPPKMLRKLSVTPSMGPGQIQPLTCWLEPLFYRGHHVYNRAAVISTRSIRFKKAGLMADKAVASLLVLDVDRNGDAAAVRCSGRLVAGVNNRLYLEVSQLIPTSKRILLDLTDLTHMDSSGLGTLVRLYVSAKSAGCALQLFNIGKPIRNLLSVTRLLSVFEIVGNNNIRCG